MFDRYVTAGSSGVFSELLFDVDPCGLLVNCYPNTVWFTYGTIVQCYYIGLAVLKGLHLQF